MIEINNLTSQPVNEKFLKKVISIVLNGEQKRKIDLSVALVDPERIRKLNKKYLSKKRVTDILVFGSNWKLKNQKLPPFLKRELAFGEILICLKEVEQNAKRYRTDFKKELTRVLIHGTLHLLGYDHEKSKNEAQKMEKKENYYFKIAQQFLRSS